MKELEWTKEVPSEDGKYWIKSRHHVTVVSIEGGELLRFGREGLNRKPDYYKDLEWYGPIQPPE